MKKMVPLVLTLLIVINSIYMPAFAASQAEISGQAKTLIEEAVEKGLIPTGSSRQYQSDITRHDFGLLIGNLIEIYKEITLKQLCESIGANAEWYIRGTIDTGGKGSLETNHPYSDIEDYSIFNLYSAGVFTGIVTGNRFEPTKAVSREEAAAIIYNAAKLMGKSSLQSGTYADSGSISTFAKEGVDFAVSNNIFKTDNSRFLPENKLTYEQAYILVLDFYNYLNPIVKDLPFAIAPRYDTAYDFSEGLALVSRDNKYFYIDRAGNEVIQLPDYENINYVSDFKNGVAYIKLVVPDTEIETVIVIDKSGKEVFRINQSSELYQIINNDFSLGYLEYRNQERSKVTAIDLNGNKHEDTYLRDCIGGFTDGMSRFGSRNNLYGVKDEMGKVLIEPKYEYDEIEFLGDGYISLGKNYDWGIFDKSGKEIVKTGQYRLLEISEKSLLVQENQSYRLIDKSGAVLFECDKPFEYKEDVAFVRKDGINLIIDRLGNTVYQFNGGGNVYEGFSESLAAIKKGSDWIIIDRSYNVVARISSKTAFAFVLGFKEGLAAVGDWSNKWGFADKAGNVVVQPQYKWVEGFKHGLAVFGNEDDRVGCIDRAGNIVFEPIYDEIEVGNGIVVVSKDNQRGLYDSQGKEILKLQSKALGLTGEIRGAEAISYDGFAYYEDENGQMKYISRARERVDAVRVGGEGAYIAENRVRPNPESYYNSTYGYFDEHGDRITEIKYRHAGEYGNDIPGLARVTMDYGRSGYDKIGYIDKSGNIIIPIEYESIGKFVEGIALATKGFKYGYIDNKGDVIISFMYDDGGSFSEGMARVSKNGKYGYIANPDR